MSKNKIKQTTMNFDNSSEYLHHLVYDGARMRYGNISEDIKKRLDFELQVINSRNWAGYFLLIRDMVHTIRTKGAVTGPGGGALPGSLVAYCLQITNVDPMAYDLLFERFANSEYNLPSFYVCVDIEGKNEAIGYLKKKGITNKTELPEEQLVGGDAKSISVFSEAAFEIYLAGMKSLSVIRESAETNGELSDIFENADMNVVFRRFRPSNYDIFKNADMNVAVRRFRPSNIEELAAMYVFAVKSIKSTNKTDRHVNCIPSGFRELDRIMGGWRPGELVIIASPPMMGKTAFMLSMASNIAIDHRYGVALFSLEMSKQQLFKRMMVVAAEIDSEIICAEELEDYERKRLETKIYYFVKSRSFIDDTPALSDLEFFVNCRKFVYQHDIRVAFIDYLQLMTLARADFVKDCRQHEVSNILCSLKGIAKELNIPIIVLSQLKAGEKHSTGLQSNRPQLADLCESPDTIEQYADMVAFIHRPEYYGFIEDEQGNSLSGVAEITIAKNSNGALGDVRLAFDKNFAKFS